MFQTMDKTRTNIPWILCMDRSRISMENHVCPWCVHETRGMLIYAAIYTEKFPMEGPQILKYIKTVRDLKGKCPSTRWRFYDEQFRMLKQQMEWAWSFINWELYFAATIQTNNSQNAQQPKKNRPFRVPRDYCYAVHTNNSCRSNPCQYKHECYSCGENHAAKFCGPKPSQGQTQSRPESGSSRRRDSNPNRRYQSQGTASGI